MGTALARRGRLAQSAPLTLLLGAFGDILERLYRDQAELVQAPDRARRRDRLAGDLRDAVLSSLASASLMSSGSTLEISTSSSARDQR